MDGDSGGRRRPELGEPGAAPVIVEDVGGAGGMIAVAVPLVAKSNVASQERQSLRLEQRASR